MVKGPLVAVLRVCTVLILKHDLLPTQKIKLALQVYSFNTAQEKPFHCSYPTSATDRTATVHSFNTAQEKPSHYSHQTSATDRNATVHFWPCHRSQKPTLAPQSYYWQRHSPTFHPSWSLSNKWSRTILHHSSRIRFSISCLHCWNKSRGTGVSSNW